MPHITLKTFDQITLPFPIDATIKGVVVDKDNCFAKDHDDKVWPEYEETWKVLQSKYKDNLLIVSNSAGTNDDIDYVQATKLENDTGVKVLRHPTKKPGCYNEILEYFEERGIKPNEIIVVGDRLFTDVLMANMMGSWGLWLSEGVEELQKIFPRFERGVYGKLTGRGYVPPESK